MFNAPRADTIHARLLESLSALHHCLGGSMPAGQLHQQVLEVFLEVAQADRAGILLVDPDGVLRFKAQQGIPDEVRRELENKLTWPRDAPDAPPILLPDRDAPTEVSGRIGTLVSFPLWCANRLLGRLVVGYDKARRFDEQQLKELQQVASHVAFVVDRQLVETRLQRLSNEYDQILHAVGEGVVVQRADGQLTFVNEAAARIVGFANAAQLIGMPMKELLQCFVITDEVGRPLPHSALPGTRALGGEWAEAQLFIQLHGSNERRALRIKATPMFDEVGRVRQAVSVLCDVTAELGWVQSVRRSQQRTEARIDRLTRLQRLTAGMYRAVRPDEVAEMLVGDCADGFSASLAMLWLWSESGQQLELKHAVGASAQVQSQARHLVVDPNNSLFRSFWHSEPMVLSGEELRGAMPALADPHTGLVTYACLPVVMKGERTGLLLLGFAQARTFRHMDHAFFAAVGEQIGHVLERSQLFESERQARAEAEAAHQRAAFLAEASAVLARSQLLEDTLPAVAALAVENLADWCEIILLDEHGEPSTVALASHPQVRAEPWVGGARKPGPAPDALLSRALRYGRSQFLPHCGEEPRFRELGIQSAMVVPMRARDRVVGALCMGSSAPSHFAPKDLELVESLADRASLAVDNVRLYQQAHDSLRAREHLLAILAHDLRAPLGVTQMKAQQLRRRLPAHSQLRTYVDAILRAGWMTNDMIRDLLDVAALQRGDVSVRPAPVPVKALLAEAFEKLSAIGHDRHVTTHIHPTASEAVVMCERTRIGQVFSNLLGNAFRATPLDGTVTVRVERKGEQLQFSIEDTGPGIPAEALPQLFRQYWKAGPEVSAVGLGLFIARELVQAHRGEMRVESHFGVGTTVFFTLPLAVH